MIMVINFMKKLLISGLLLCFFGCKPSSEISRDLEKPICIPSQSECAVNTKAGQFKVSFNQQQPAAETPFEIHVEYNGEQTIKSVSGYLEGIDMFMGKIPLIFTEFDSSNKNERLFIAKAMFGACSFEQMKWKAIFIADIEDNENLKQALFSISFTSKGIN